MLVRLLQIEPWKHVGRSIDMGIDMLSIHTAQQLPLLPGSPEQQTDVCTHSIVSQARPCCAAHMQSLLSVICRRSSCGPCLKNIMKTKATWPSLQRRCQEASAGGRSPASCASWASSRPLAASIRARRGRRRCCTKIS